MEKRKAPLKNDSIKFVMIGETGVGKSTLGNALLKKEECFKTGPGIEAITEKARTEDGTLLGLGQQSVSITDTQGYNDPNGKDFDNAI